MQKDSKPKFQSIVLAHTLKPLSDPRMTFKLGMSLYNSCRACVQICGNSNYQEGSLPTELNYYPLFSFRRLSLKRFLSSFKFMYWLAKHKPDLVIVGTHELLVPATLYKLFFGKHAWYDIRENYFKNIVEQPDYPYFLKLLLATYIRLKELVLVPVYDKLLLAEQCYVDQLPFAKNNFVVLENKSVANGLNPVKRKGPQNSYVFNGSISEISGVFRAIRFFKKLKLLDATATLTIIGVVYKQTLHESLARIANDTPGIEYVGSLDFMNHEEIMEVVSRCDFGLMSYEVNESYDGKIPTKLYEYWARGTVIIADKQASWAPLIETTKSGILIDYSNTSEQDLMNILSFDRRTMAPNLKNIASWKHEEDRLISLINN